jgi:hypothetical protein
MGLNTCRTVSNEEFDAHTTFNCNGTLAQRWVFGFPPPSQ